MAGHVFGHAPENIENANRLLDTRARRDVQRDVDLLHDPVEERRIDELGEGVAIVRCLHMDTCTARGREE